MISKLMELLHSEKFEGVSHNIEVAKGLYEKPKKVAEVFIKFKRKLKWQKKGL
jgi:hypothetical protein